MADSAIANLEMGIGVTRAAVARITLQFVLAEQEAPGNPRPIRAWRRCLLRAVTEDGPRIQRKINRERAAEDRDAELDRHYSDLRQADHYRRQHERYGGSNRSRDPAPPRPIADTGDGLSAYLERMARKRS